MKKVSVEFLQLSRLNWPDEMIEELSNSDVTWGCATHTLVDGATLRANLDEAWSEYLEEIADHDLVDLES